MCIRILDAPKGASLTEFSMHLDILQYDARVLCNKGFVIIKVTIVASVLETDV
jgi:hypothetical protein